MKKIIFTILCISVFPSCSNKESSSVPDLSNMSASPSTAPPENSETKQVEGNKNLPGFALIQSSDCLSCHKENGKLVGPSYSEVAVKYTEKDANHLASKIIEGGSGIWGDIPMQAHPNISKEDAKKMAEYILSVKN